MKVLPLEEDVIQMQVKAIKAKTVFTDESSQRHWPLSEKDADYLRRWDFNPRAIGSVVLALEGNDLVEQIKFVGDKQPLAPMVSIGAPAQKKGKKWDDLPMAKRVKRVKRAGLPGTHGSKAWVDFTKAERHAIKTGEPVIQFTLKSESPEARAARFNSQPDSKHLAAHGGDRFTSLPEVDGEPVQSQTSPKGAPRHKLPANVAPQDYLMWVGSKNYPTIRDFVREARVFGCSKRIGRILNGLVPGATRIFLAHDEGFTGEGCIFGYFIVKNLEIVVEDGEELPVQFLETGVAVSASEAQNEPERRSGWRSPGGIYLVSETDRDALKTLAKELGTKRGRIKGGLILFDPPKDFGGHKHFRGAKRVKGDKIMRREKTRTPMSFDHPMPDKQPKWTLKEEQQLLMAVASQEPGEPLARIFTAFAFRTGHARTRVAYRYEKLTKET